MHKLSLIKRCCPNFLRGGAGQQKEWGQRGRAQKREERDLSIQVLGEMERGGEGRRYQVPKCAHFGGTKKGRKFDNLRSQAHSLLLSSESLLLSLSRARFLSLKTLSLSLSRARALSLFFQTHTCFQHSQKHDLPLSLLSLSLSPPLYLVFTPISNEYGAPLGGCAISPRLFKNSQKSAP
jgi:hypothetical protein